MGKMECKRYFKARPFFFIIIDIIATIPYEYFYLQTFKDDSIVDATYYLLGLRNSLRLYRLLFFGYQLRASVGFNHLLLTLCELAFGFYSVTLFFMLMIYYSFNVRVLSNECFEVFSYLIYKTTGFGFELLDKYPTLIFYYMLPLSAIVFLQLGFAISLSTCALLQKLREKMMFATSVHIWTTRVGARYNKDIAPILNRTLNTYSLYCWRKRRKLGRNFEYDKIITNTMTREIKLDLCFNALKHSNLFRKCEINVLRHLSTLMSVTFMTPGELLLRKHKFNTSMIYIITGIVQLLSQEDGETPILSFSGGTVLGETSLFLSHPCPCTVICQSYCEIVVLKKIDFLSLVHYYPEVFKHLLYLVKMRYLQARLYVTIFNYQLKLKESRERREVLTLKWLKSVSKKLHRDTDHEENEIKRLRDRKHDEIFQNCLFVTYFLDQIVLTEEIELNTQAIMYKKTFPFVFLPNTVVSWLWEQLIASVALMHTIVYVYHVCLTDHFNFYSIISWIITLLWALDVLYQISTAVKTKDKLVTKISEIIIIKLKTLAFWIDIVAAFPLDILVQLIMGSMDIQNIHKFQCNRLLKSYRLYSLFSTSHINVPSRIVFRTKLRYIVTTCLITSNIAGIIYLQLCPDFECNDVFENFLTTVQTKYSDSILKFIICTYIAIGVISGVNFEYIPLKDSETVILVLQFLKIITNVYFIAELSAVKALRNDIIQTFNEYKTTILDVCRIWSVNETYLKRIKRYLDVYSKDTTLLVNVNDLATQIPEDLYKIGMHNLLGNLTTFLPILRHLPEEVLARICVKIRTTLIIPPGEVIIYHGEVCKEMYILEAGCCRVYYQTGLISKIIGPGESFCVYESCKSIPAMISVVTLTHCKVFALKYDDYILSFSHFPHLLKETKDLLEAKDTVSNETHHEYPDIKNMDREVSDVIPAFKKFGYTLSRDTPEGEDYYIPFDKNDLTYYVKYLLLRVTFHCGGKFCFYWEISRCVFIFASAILSPMAVIAAYNARHMKHVLMFLDITAYLDIYIRHHITYYDKKNIEVTHPLKTAIYYWKHSFLVDVFSVAPLTKIIPLLLRMKPDSSLLVVLRLNRLIQFYRILLFLNKIAEETNKRFIKFLMYYVLLLFIINTVASILVITNCEYDQKLHKTHQFSKGLNCYDKSIFYPAEVNSFDAPYTATKIQCLALYFVSSIICGVPVEGFRLETGEVYIQVILLALTGVFFIMYVTTNMVSVSLLKNVELINFQNLLSELVKFINYRKIDVKLKNEVIEHFEFFWRKKRGKEERKLFHMFNSSLQEDIMYNMYGKTLHHNSIFSNANKSFYKSLLNYTTHNIFLNLGIILRINECHSKIYFLVKGTVDVLGPDYNHLVYLPVGSMFGALDNTEYMRQTLTLVAKGHVELLVINNKIFHSILSRYTSQKEQYKQLTYFHTDFLVGRSSIKGESNSEKPISSNKTSRKRRLYQTYKKIKKPSFFKKVYHGKNIKVWKIFVLVIVCFIGFMIELYQKNSLDTHIYILTTLYIFDLIFIINIYLNFHVAYYDDFGILVTDLKKISKRYRRKKFGFWMDLISCLPIEVIAFFFSTDTATSLWTFGRWNRTIRVIHVIRYFHAINNKLHINVLLMRTVYLSIWITVVVQLIMNIYFLIASIDESLYYYNNHNIQTSKVSKYFEQLLVIIYFASGTQVKNFFPNDPIILICTVLLLVGIRFLLVFILGELCATMEVSTSFQYGYEADINELRRSMINDDLAVPLQERAWLYVRLLWMTSRGKCYPPLLKQSPNYLKEGILNAMFGYHLRKHPVLKNCHVDFLRQLSTFFQTRTYIAGDYITFIGDIDGCMYFIEEGCVLAIEKETVSTQIVSKVLHSGDMFGFNQGVYPRVGHAYTYKADTYCLLLELQQKNWIYLLDFFPATKYVIYNAKEYLHVTTED